MSESESAAADFAPVSREQWKAKVIEDLKGTDPDTRLLVRTRDGRTQSPLLVPHPASEPELALHRSIPIGDWAAGIITGAATAERHVAVARSREARVAWVESRDPGQPVFDALRPAIRVAAPHLAVVEQLLDPARLAHATTEAVRDADLLAVPAWFVERAGGHDVEELAVAASIAVDLLRAAEAGGRDLDSASGALVVQLATGRDFFGTLAKFRAFRWIWASVAQAIGVGAKPALHAFESQATRTVAAPWTNLLRTTVEATAAILGGADVVCIRGHDAATGPASDEAIRLALNTLLVLRHESHLGHATDPAAGSASVDALTVSLADAAWARFQAIEAAGGIAAALTSGDLARRLGEQRASFALDIARRKALIVGVTDFADLGDERPLPVPVDGSDPYAPIRWAAPVERLRSQLESGGERPTATLLVGSPIEKLRARVSFARSLFAVAGMRCVEVAEADVGDLAGGIVCVCATDDDCGPMLTRLAPRFAQASVRQVWAAIRPGDREADLRQAGAQHFAYAGCDVVEFIKTLSVASPVQR
jgi:methylmalonyl-CoA mutase